MAGTIPERASAWITGHDTGASSKAIWAVMMGRELPRYAYPSDDDDLGRCLRLLDAIPEWKPRLREMERVSPYWAALVQHWDELSFRHRDGRNVSARMRQILDPIEAEDPAVIRVGGGVSIRFGHR
jgi:hypothetical protein